MNPEEETATARVTRGALRRRSIDQESSSGVVTPKKTTGRKSAVLNIIEENSEPNVTKSEGHSNLDQADKTGTPSRPTRSVHKIRNQQEKSTPRPRSASLTETNVAILENALEGSTDTLRRTPRRRPSQEVTTPRRITRRSSTSDDATLVTPSVTNTVHPTIVEDEEKDSSPSDSQLEQLDVRKLRNRSISRSPVPKGSPASKNTSAMSIKSDNESDTGKTDKPDINTLNEPMDQSVIGDETKKEDEEPATEELVDEMETTNKTETLMEVDECIESDVPASTEAIDTANTEATTDTDAPESASQPENTTTELSSSVPEGTSAEPDLEPVTAPQNEHQPEKGEESTTAADKPTGGVDSPQDTVSSSSVKQQHVTFEEKTPEREIHSSYRKTPTVPFKTRRVEIGSEQIESDTPKEKDEKGTKTTPDEEFEINETMPGSPKQSDQQSSQPSSQQVDEEATEIPQTPEDLPSEPVAEVALEKSPQQPDKDLDKSLENIVQDIRENIQDANLSISILETPKATDKQKSRFSRFVEGSSSTPIAAPITGAGRKVASPIAEEEPVKMDDNSSRTEDMTEITSPSKKDKSTEQEQKSIKKEVISPETEEKSPSKASESAQEKKKPVSKSKSLIETQMGSRGDPDDDGSQLSKSWSKVLKGTGGDQGIDLFSVRKQEEQKQKDEESKRLNKSSESKSPSKKRPRVLVDRSEDEDENDDQEENGEDDRNSMLDDEAMEALDYQSGDSLDSETRAEMRDNEVPVEGESIGSQDSEEEDDEEDEDLDDSFIASDSSPELLDVSEEDETDPEKQEDGSDSEDEIKTASRKKRKRIIQPNDSSDEEAEEGSTSKNDVSQGSLNSSPKVALNSSTKSGESSASEVLPKKVKTQCSLISSSETSLTGSVDKANSSTREVSLQKSPNKSNSQISLKSSPRANTSVSKECLSPQMSTEKAESQDVSMSSPKDLDRSPNKTNTSSTEEHLSPKKASPEKSLTQNSPVKSPESKTQQAESNAKSSSPTEEKKQQGLDTGPLKSRKSLPAPALISAEFYAPSAKSNKRHTMNVVSKEDAATDEQLDQAVTIETPKVVAQKSPKLVANPAAMALAKKNKRASLDSAAACSEKIILVKRTSLPGKLAGGKLANAPMTNGSPPKQTEAEQENENDKNEDADQVASDQEQEAMEVSEDEENSIEEAETGRKVRVPPVKDISEFDHDAILSRCNEIVRADKEKKKKGATLKQKKKDEKRRQKELEEKETEGDEPKEQQTKKKKKKKKQTNYLLEELGDTKKELIQKALERKKALLEAKQERKKAKKLAKLHLLNDKENQQQQTGDREGIGSKFDKKGKKKKQLIGELNNAIENPNPKEVVIRPAVSAYAVYSSEIEKLKKEMPTGKKKHKQLKENCQQMEAAEEVQISLANKSNKMKKEKTSFEADSSRHSQKSISVIEGKENNSQLSKKSKKEGTAANENGQPDKLSKEVVPECSEKVSKKHKQKSKQVDAEDTVVEKYVNTTKKSKKHRKELPDQSQHEVPSVSEEMLQVESTKKSKKHRMELTDEPQHIEPTITKQIILPDSTKNSKKHRKEVAAKSISKKIKQTLSSTTPSVEITAASLEDELAQLKKSISEPISKVVKKLKLSHSDAVASKFSELEVTPPRKTATGSGKLKALKRLECGFVEEPVTPQHQLLKRNHGFTEEPVTPKPLGFRVSDVLPAGRAELEHKATEAKKNKASKKSEVKEPQKGLPQPVWTRSGTFDVQELDDVIDHSAVGKMKKPAGKSDYIALNPASKCSTEFYVKPLTTKKHSEKVSSKLNRVDPTIVDEGVLNFKKQAIFGKKNARLREKTSKY